MTTQNLLETLRHIVGAKYVITDPSKTERYRTGYRFGTGNAIAVVRPATLWEQWQVLEACVAADVIVISQAANTGITGGSNPFGNDYDRDVVIINTMRNDNIQLILDAKQAICLTGATLNHLEQELKPHNREPHSVIGSSCIGASVIGGVCNNSGGSLVQRGPAYTEMALYAQRNANGKLELINHLGIDLGSSPKEILTNLQEGRYQAKDIHTSDKKGHDHDYCNHVREINANTPARFNADPARLYEASGSAGRLGVFAVRVDTFPAEKKTAVFYIGTNNTAVLTKLRRDMLGTFEEIPISGEYIHRTAFDIAAKYGKDTFWYIKNVGTEYLPKLFSLKAWGDRVAKKLPFMPNHFSEKFLQFTSKLMPQHLPKILWDYRNQYEHHLILKMGGKGVDEARAYLQKEFADSTKGAYIECDAKLAQAAMLLRFAVASAAIRYRSVHEDEVEDIVALDIALRRNDEDWFEKLPPELDAKILYKLYYGHFMCHVFHQDYVIKKGYNCEEIEEEMLKILDTRGAQYPAEHNVGHLYHANDDLKNFYNSLDPTNSFNPGIGKTSKKKDWK
ncbi:D-lactate dehydrogenase [Capnocytophaga ochracea DSM 7271]|jgi:D-lactate dehydrogenase|uniref:Quinone-dependent D-lactate dehydrogenase n=2 Tax=Capnocytophaga ochracea TaxID=1018 RepID=C7M6Y2_CAPOD|nr:MULTISPECIES: D-lactate dehydrogenase [Capnocytophaga]ACU93108.1 D-lactate dehydrogenase [Capnocytophaga ochracea DSM 7271]QLF50999.1 D-lactate dehydrogenase [Capnocytophaga sp. oral taxon 902]UAK51806.1 D-lactate dehydrogenase [Capnocytophaga ochracea]UZD41567.1 D-lactate dehydrogenase [Capnocytophaga ochracea]